MPHLIRVAEGTGGSASYTLSDSETWTLQSVVAELAASVLGADFVPVLRVTDQSGEIIAEIVNAKGFA